MFPVEESLGQVVKRQVLNLIGWTMTFLAAAFLVLYSVAQFDDDPPVRWTRSDPQVTTDEDGKSFFVSRTTCVDKMKPAEALPRLIGVGNNLLIPLPQKPMSARMGCNDYTVLVLLPEQTPKGLYEYHYVLRIEMNPFKKIDVEAPPVLVTVLK